MQFHLCKLIRLSTATGEPPGSAPCQAPTNVRGGRQTFGDRQMVPEQGTWGWQRGFSLGSRGRTTPAPVVNILVNKAIWSAVTEPCNTFVSNLSTTAGVLGMRQHPAHRCSQPAFSSCWRLVPWVLIRLTAAQNPCQSPFESSLYQSNQLKGPCRASEETKAGSLLGTWDFMPNAD